jgi:cell division protein FtsW
MKTAGVLLTLAVGLLLATGLVMLSSLTVHDKVSVTLLYKQLAWIVLGVLAAVAVASMDYRRLRAAGWLLFAAVLVLLVLARTPGIGQNIRGAWRWIDLGYFSLQPSEFGKIALVLCLAAYADRFQREMPGFRRGVLVPGGLVLLLAGLVLAGKDYGTTALLLALAAALLLVGGARPWHLAPPFLGAAAVLLALVLANPTKNTRLDAWLNPAAHADGTAHQAIQAGIAIGSGGLTGRGLGEGLHKRGYVPDQHTDFIFSAIGEELGLAGTGGVLLAYLVLLAAGCAIAARARDLFGVMLAFGATFAITLQAAVNVGVVTGVLPNKGLALPFVSYGGSSLLAMLTLVGLLFSVARRAGPAADGELAGLPGLDAPPAAGPAPALP